MSSKVSIDDVAEALKHSKVDPATLRRIIEELNLKVEKTRSASAGPKAKTQIALLVSDPTGALAGKDLVAWAFKIEGAGSPSTLVARIEAAASAYHMTKKGRLYPAKTIGEVIESVPRKHWATNDEGTRTQVLTKTPVQVMTTSNSLSVNTQARTT